MKESFLHFIWKHGLFPHNTLKTTDGQTLELIHRGTLNSDGGPDFQMAELRLNQLLLHGAVEIHVKSSDWFLHKHEDDPAYNTTILHAVYTHDRDVRTQAGDTPATLELQALIPKSMYGEFEALHSQFHFPSCAAHQPDFADLHASGWLHIPLEKRLQNKANFIANLLKELAGDWEAVFYRMLCRSVGGKVNAQAMDTLSVCAPLHLLRRLSHDSHGLEALLLGQAGLLPKSSTDAHVQSLIKEAAFLRHKFQLEPMNPVAWKYLRMRPAGFPDIRLAQLAALLTGRFPMFRQLMDCTNVSRAAHYLRAEAHPFWQEHYTLREKSTPHSASLGTTAIHHILINAVIPTMYAYGQHSQQPQRQEQALRWLQQLEPENNKYTKVYEQHGMPNPNAYASQAILGLRSEYCEKKQCLQCPIGMRIISKKPLPSVL